MTYPCLLLKEGDVQLVAADPCRVNIFWQGKFQGWRKFYSKAVSYCLAEGLLTTPPTRIK